MDKNADGLLESDEYANANQPQLMQQARQMVAFAQFDDNKDGFIGPDELPNPTAQLRQLDTNNDGSVSKREMRTGLRARRAADDS
jgi:Ca2+-binding EF-hand superfamily protein